MSLLEVEQLKSAQQGRVTDCYDSFEFEPISEQFADECPVNHLYTPETYSTHVKIIEGLRTIYDPEIALNIYDLGLIYGIQTNDEQKVKVCMTLTSANCPAAESMPEQIKSLVYSIVQKQVEVVLYWDPPWDAQRVSEAGKLELGLMD